MAEIRYIIFELDDEIYSINLKYVREIEENYAIVPIPNCPENIKGIINLRGEVVPVYSLRSRFQKAENREMGKIILTYVHGAVIGFEVDRIQGIETLGDQDMLEAPKLILNDETSYIECILRAAAGIVVNISVENILSESEVIELTESLSED